MMRFILFSVFLHLLLMMLSFSSDQTFIPDSVYAELVYELLPDQDSPDNPVPLLSEASDFLPAADLLPVCTVENATVPKPVQLSKPVKVSKKVENIPVSSEKTSFSSIADSVCLPLPVTSETVLSQAVLKNRKTADPGTDFLKNLHTAISQKFVLTGRHLRISGELKLTVSFYLYPDGKISNISFSGCDRKIKVTDDLKKALLSLSSKFPFPADDSGTPLEISIPVCVKIR